MTREQSLSVEYGFSVTEKKLYFCVKLKKGDDLAFIDDAVGEYMMDKFWKTICNKNDFCYLNYLLLMTNVDEKKYVSNFCPNTQQLSLLEVECIHMRPFKHAQIQLGLWFLKSDNWLNDNSRI